MAFLYAIGHVFLPGKYNAIVMVMFTGLYNLEEYYVQQAGAGK
jgi:hypothetical protein